MWAKLRLINEQDASESSYIEVIVNQLKSHGDTTFTENAVTAKVMSSLPAGYDTVLSAKDTTANASKTLDVLSLRMY